MNKDDIIQAIVIADNFTDEFIPITNDLPFCLLPVVNKPLIDYTLEFLALGGIDETFLFCCTHVDAIKTHIKESIETLVEWSLTMKIHIIVSESCCSFGDCLRDIDAKGLLRSSFVLIEPGTVSNIKLSPIVKTHNETFKKDKGAAMTLIYQEAGIGQLGRCPKDDILLAANNDNNRVLFHRKLGIHNERKMQFPLEIFMDNSNVSIHHNLRDTHIAICSPSVLPLFSDNFDFQTKDDFIKGLLINEEILDSRIYYHIIKGTNYGGCITSWRMYQAINYELINNWIYPLQPSIDDNCHLKNKVIIGKKSIISTNHVELSNSIIGDHCKIGRNVEINNSFILGNCKIEDNVIINHSMIGPNCWIKSKCKITSGCVLGKNVIVESGRFIENSLVQSTQPEDCGSDKLSSHAYKLHVEDDDELSTRFSRFSIGDYDKQTIGDTFSDESEEDDEFNRPNSPLPDDTKLFFNEVIDSLTRGFEDELQCDNLILEINSSRYAYNVTVKEVNFNVIKAILIMSLRLSIGQQYFSQFLRLLSYFSPILMNYIRNESAMIDALQAVENVANHNETINEKWIMFVLKWFYDKDFITEDAILNWANSLEHQSKLYQQVKPFIDWLEEAEEESDGSD